MAWIWSGFGSEQTAEDEEHIDEEEDLQREQEQINLIGRSGEEGFSVPSLPPLQMQRSGMLLPYMCCPPTPLLVSPVLAGRLQRISPTWEQLEAGVLVVIITLLLWGLLWIVFGAAAGPWSAPFYVMLMSLAGHGLGALMEAFTPLPPQYGMLLLPAVLANLGVSELEVLSHLRGDVAPVIVFAAVSVFIARSGVDVELAALKSSWGLVLALAFLPLLAEMVTVTLAGTYVLDLSWRWGFVLGAVIAPTAPLVVMWSAMELRQEQGEAAGTSGMSREASSLLLVVAALDAAVASCLLGVSVQFAQSTESWSTVSSGLLQLVGGILLGALIGFFSIYVPNEHNVHATFYRVEMMLAINVCSVMVFHYVMHMPAVGYLSGFTASCVAYNGWRSLSMDSQKTSLRTMMSLSWFIVQPLAMSIVGTHIMVSTLGHWRVIRFIGVLFFGVLVRFGVSILCFAQSRRRWKELLFICMACTPKGTVQLVSCSWTLFRTFQAEQDAAMAAVVMNCSVLALLVTGPLGSILTALLAPRVPKEPDQS